MHPIGSIFIWYLLVSVIVVSCQECPFCKKTFKSLNRHSWRCPAKLQQIPSQVERNHGNDGILVSSNDFVLETSERSIVNLDNNYSVTTSDGTITEYDENQQKEARASETSNTSNYVKCYCGKECLGIRGLKAHKRSCHITDIPELKDLFQFNEDDYINDDNDSLEGIEHVNSNESSSVLSGVKLPKTQEEWNAANDYFKTRLNNSEAITDVEAIIKTFQSTIYEYFQSYYGTVNDNSNDSTVFGSRYNHLSRRQLKKSLAELKRTDPDNHVEIKYVASLLRFKYSKKSHEFIPNENHNDKINKNFWKYCKETFEIEDDTLPNFDKVTCEQYFRKILRMKGRGKSFDLPSWMKRTNPPESAFDRNAPTYKEISKIISKMKARGSPCPLDQMSCIVLKRCPILRTILHKIIVHCWEMKICPEIWKSAFTILIYKKGCNQNPENFRPITLQPVFAKIFSSVIRNRIYGFLIRNNYIETNIQKGFWDDISGTIEHTEHLSHLINHARLHQREVIVTLLDLRNAFGTVDHRLIKKVLEYHHVPEEIQCIIASYYENYKIRIGTSAFTTDEILVKNGVLQGDCLSPLLFNMVVNTLIKCIDDERIKCLGYNYSYKLTPKHWFQFADDTAVVTSTAEDMQLLLNVFSKWCYWASLEVRVDKCSTFGIKKNGVKSVQFNPYFRINNEMVPTVSPGKSFKYLGKEFSFDMKTVTIQEELISDLNEYLEKLDRLPLHTRNKLLIINRYIYSKLRWRFSIYNLSETWVKQNMDNKVAQLTRKWLHLHVGANFRHLYLSASKLGLDFKLPSDIFRYSQLTTRKILKNSVNDEIKELYKITANKYVTQDSYMHHPTKQPSKVLNEDIVANINNNLSQLKEQNTIMGSLKETCSATYLQWWKTICENLPNNIFGFSRKALVFSLANKSNLFRWKKSPSDKCDLCGNKQTQLHVLNNCSTAVTDGRLTWRHNSILYTMWYYLSQLTDCEILVDLPGHKSPGEVFRSLIPDLLLKRRSEITIIELTCCFETNTKKSRNYKIDRYVKLEENCEIQFTSFKKIYVEVTSLGFITKDIKEFILLFKNTNINTNRMIKKLMETAIRCSYFLYVNRNKPWSETKILQYF